MSLTRSIKINEYSPKSLVNERNDAIATCARCSRMFVVVTNLSDIRSYSNLEVINLYSCALIAARLVRRTCAEPRQPVTQYSVPELPVSATILHTTAVDYTRNIVGPARCGRSVLSVGNLSQVSHTLHANSSTNRIGRITRRQ